MPNRFEYVKESEKRPPRSILTTALARGNMNASQYQLRPKDRAVDPKEKCTALSNQCESVVHLIIRKGNRVQLHHSKYAQSQFFALSQALFPVILLDFTLSLVVN